MILYTLFSECKDKSILGWLLMQFIILLVQLHVKGNRHISLFTKSSCFMSAYISVPMVVHFVRKNYKDFYLL